jgi:hypothetical protein
MVAVVAAAVLFVRPLFLVHNRMMLAQELKQHYVELLTKHVEWSTMEHLYRLQVIIFFSFN